jgi:hypothetical protein
VSTLRLTSKDRTERLTEDEAERISQILGRFLPTSWSLISFPEDTPTVEVVVESQDLPLAPAIADHVTQILGRFDEKIEAV